MSAPGEADVAGEPTGGEGVSVVVPVYNSAESVAELVDRLEATLSGLPGEHEIVLVNDDSGDGSWEQILAAAERNPSVRGVDLMRNYGQHNALLAGIREARFGITVTMDDDLQHPPEEIPKLLAGLTDDVDVVYGSPERFQYSLWRRTASRVTKRALQAAMGAETAKQISSYRAFRTHLREGFATYQAPYVSIDALLTWSTRKFTSVPVRHEDRATGESNFGAWDLVRHAITLITAFTTRPLQLASVVGFMATLFGILALIVVLVDYLISGRDVRGFAFLASLITILAGAQLFALGVIGEYLARMHVRSMDRPAYAVRTTVPDAEGGDGSAADADRLQRVEELR